MESPGTPPLTCVCNEPKPRLPFEYPLLCSVCGQIRPDAPITEIIPEKCEGRDCLWREKEKERNEKEKEKNRMKKRARKMKKRDRKRKEERQRTVFNESIPCDILSPLVAKPKTSARSP